MPILQIELNTTGPEDAKGAKSALIGAILQRHIPFARDTVRNLYYYSKGVYHPNGEQLVRELYLQLMIQWQKETEWKSNQVSEIIEFLLIHAPQLWAKPP